LFKAGELISTMNEVFMIAFALGWMASLCGTFNGMHVKLAFVEVFCPESVFHYDACCSSLWK